MALRPLTRDDFEFETCCYVCDPANGQGLGVAFFVDEDASRVVADYRPVAEHTGAPGIVHGGVLGAVLDDAMAWAVNTLTDSFGLTQRAETEFLRSVRTGSTYAVAAWVEEVDEGRAVAVAELRDHRDRVCATMRGQFSLVTREEAARIFARRPEAAPDGGGT